MASASASLGEATPRCETKVLSVDVDVGVPAALKAIFEPALRKALDGRGRAYRLDLRRGRDDQEVVVKISAAGRRPPLPLYFPRASGLDEDAVLRIVRNVLESMGPAAP